jgi:hypothetical protein
MDWFEKITGFQETNYVDTRAKLKVEGSRLQSLINGNSYATGDLELISLCSLGERAKSGGGLNGRLTLTNVTGDVRRLHQSPEYGGALFQVASQFNLLEMVSPEVTPEHGVTGYQHDRTQGPACAIAAGAGTIYRNYFVPVGGECGQTAQRQLDGLADIGTALGHILGLPVNALWKMRNGYALCTRDGLAAIDSYLRSATAAETDALRALLRIGVHRDVEVTDGEGPERRVVSQAFCSALPVAYSGLPAAQWQNFAQLILDAAYEATLWAAVMNAKRGSSTVVLLTRLGGGAFGNDDAWIDSAMRSAITKFKEFSLNVRVVSFGATPPSMLILENEFK